MRSAVIHQKGFTLLEAAIAVIIAGFLLGGALVLLDRANEQNREAVTENNMQVILKALAQYADSTSRLPCPADPGRADDVFGWEWGVNAAQISTGRPTPPAGNTCQTWGDPAAPGNPPKNIGIVPFLTLDIDPAFAKDGWGRYFTYAVSPVFAQINDDSGGAADTGLVHARCLDGAWIDSSGDIINAPKAKFCCAKGGNAAPLNAASDIRIFFIEPGGATTMIWPRGAPDTEFYNNARTADQYKQMQPAPAFPYVTHGAINDQSQLAAPAFVLISHGENGYGAFLGNNTRNRYFGPNSAVGAGERENGGWANANGYDRDFYLGPRSDAAGINHFDDIVLWRTQDSLLAETGTSSCAYP